ncbi:Tetratricopeptide repeat protein 29 [Dufourea novaeangliae]|uniref:Tetratricopeptide repeat protein 29 n=1 Tax=Dufourea novaeangliae TaxID=178035 RepID=A0A154P557_DUFNO|nr:Tetratricopeptide repeat protein 29 [Dufourea novaeangliae]
MTEQRNRVKKYDVVEVLKRDDYKEWSSSSSSRISERIVYPTKLKTLPQAELHEMDKVMADLKAALPDISPVQVRRFYMPYHEAILLELEEQSYHEAARQMSELLEVDERIAQKSVGVLLWKKPSLKDNKDFIDRLREGLIAFEKAKRKGDYVARATALLDTALFFQVKAWEWWWIAERLYQAALSAAEFIEDDNLQNPREALDYLNEAREASEKKTWNASKKLAEKQGSIFKECNVLLYKALLILARKDRPNNPDAALKACLEALERATTAGEAEYLNETLYELGKSYIAVNDVRRALQTFSKLLAVARRVPDAEGVCNAHMELAFAYKQLDDTAHTEKHLRMFRENAEKLRLFEKLADAHYYTGEHYLSQGNLGVSTVHLENALSLYNKLGLSHEADRARCIAGISKGQERIEEYLSLLLRCGVHDENATLKICRWKSSREPFWLEEVHGNQENVLFMSLSNRAQKFCIYI